MNTHEQRLDVIHNCEVLLNTALKSKEQTDSTAAGRMITQLKWLKERAENQDLSLPVDSAKLASLLYIYTNGDLIDLTSSPSTYREEVSIYMLRLIWLTEDGKFLTKPSFYPYVIRVIDAMVKTLKSSARPLSKYELGFVDELLEMKVMLGEGKIEPPIVENNSGKWPNFREIYLPSRTSIDDLPKAKQLMKLFYDLIINGVRPDTWLTPADADRETAAL
jgi:hypothetical protein